jgi:hypothetical protein
MATIFSGGGSRSTRREPPTMGKQLVNFITCGCESSAPFFVIYKAGANPRRIGDRLVWVVRSSDLTPQSATRRWSNVGTWLAWLVERRSWHANVRPKLGQREQPNRWVDMVGPMLARRMIFDGEICSRLANVWIWPLTNRRLGVGTWSHINYSIVCRFDFFFINTFVWYYVSTHHTHPH